MRKFLAKVIFQINIFAALLLVLSYLSVFVDPQIFWPIAFLGLSYPFLLLINLAFVVFWVIKWKKQFLLSFLAIAIGWTFFARMIQINSLWSPKEVPKKEASFKMLSFNVRLFNRFQWVKNPAAGHEIIEFTKRQSPDIICFQEFYTREKGAYSETEINKHLSKTLYRHIKYSYRKTGISGFGVATYSKFRIVSKGEIEFPKTYNVCIFTDVKVGMDTIRIYNNHLQSVRFLKQDYDFIDTLKLPHNSRDLIGFRDISKRLKLAFIKRAQQADLIAAHIARSPYPVVVCGDFNDSPVSYTYQRIHKNLEDAFMESGSGFGNTYLGKFPSFRIDYILHDKRLKSYNYRSPRLNLSDHYPVLCTIVKE